MFKKQRQYQPKEKKYFPIFSMYLTIVLNENKNLVLKIHMEKKNPCRTGKSTENVEDKNKM